MIAIKLFSVGDLVRITSPVTLIAKRKENDEAVKTITHRPDTGVVEEIAGHSPSYYGVSYKWNGFEYQSILSANDLERY
jgi:hypothetical protein